MPGGASHPLRLKVLGTTELGGAGGGEARAILAQPKRFALLVWLALAGRGRFVRRDTVIALLWPEASSDAARHALRQGLHFLRQSLGPTVVTRRGEDEVGVNAEVLWCDAVEFERALDEGRLMDALSLYAGDLLPGFFATDVSAELQWLDGERERLRRRAAEAAWRAAQDAEARGSREEAAHYARLGARFAPDDEAAFRRLLQLLDRLGDRTGALRAYEDFRRRLAEELSTTTEGSSWDHPGSGFRPVGASRLESRGILSVTCGVTCQVTPGERGRGRARKGTSPEPCGLGTAVVKERWSGTTVSSREWGDPE